MPIKFRCPECQQFLGISRSRAGAVTDCPTCGRSIRVPTLEGHVEPLPAPELNLGDAGLASALDKLASLVDSPVVESQPHAGRESRELAAAPQPKAVPLPEPMVLAPAAAPQVRAAPEPQSHQPETRAAESRPAAGHDGAIESLAQLERERIERSAAESSRNSRGVPVGMAVLLAVLLSAAMFGAGYVAGRAVEVVASSDAPAAATPAAAAASSEPAAASDVEPAITGRVSYIAEDGESRPDAGARILVLPEERQGASMLPVEGFRPGASVEDRALAIAAARALGGDFAIADETGRYRIALPKPGVFEVLILSRYQERNGPATAARLGWRPYFDRPAQVVGQAAEQRTSLRYRGSGTSPRDHTFDRP
ncbi:MAG: hypothetical protein R3B90_02255 [Planctomycetaceae bacterium]